MNPELQSFAAQGEDVRLLLDQLRNRKLVHAYLVSGEKGTGKRTLAALAAASLLCGAGGDRPCGACRDCLMAASLEHPDMVVIRRGIPIAPDVKKDRATIPVDDIREMIRICGESTLGGNARVVLLFDADKMTVQAQNCLLKTLEEPPDNTYLFLVTDHPDALLTTVISRCRPIRLKAWDDRMILGILQDRGVAPERASRVLQAAGGSIGRAIELSSDEAYWARRTEAVSLFFATSASGILAASHAWKDRKEEGNDLLDILESLLRILVGVRIGQLSDGMLSEFPDRWKRFAREAALPDIAALSDAVSAARKQLQFSVNFQAVLEQLLFVFVGEGNKWST